MAEPIASFYFEFITENLNELKDGLDDLNKKLDKVEDTGKKTTKGLDGLWQGFKKLLPEVTLLGTAYKALRTAMSLKDEIVDMQNFATAVGVGADKIEGMGRALFQFGGDWKTAATLFGSITDMMEDLKWGRLDKDELISKYGIDIVNGLISGDHFEVLKGISNAMVGQDKGAQRAIASGFLNGNQALQLFFAQGWDKVSQQLGVAMGKNFKSDPEYQRNSRELKQAVQDLKESWEQAVAPLMPAITELLEAMKPIMEAMKPLFEVLGQLFEMLKPAIHWLAEKLGKGIKEFADSLEGGISVSKAAIAWLKGDISNEEFKETVLNAKGGVGRLANKVKEINDKYKDDPVLKKTKDILTAPADITLKTLDKILGTESALNTVGGTTEITDNRTVTIEEINVGGDNSTATNIGNNIGTAVKNGIMNNVLDPVYNTMEGR